MSSSSTQKILSDRPDFVVIGAGAAGISAAHKLIGLGISVTVVEAASRIGGRAWTDTATFGVPYDVGAHWLHYDSHNFYNEYGKTNGFDIYPDPLEFHLFDQGQKLEKGLETIQDRLEEYYSDIDKATDAGLDISVQQAISHRTGKHRQTAEYILGPWTMGKEVSELSVRDVASSIESKDWFCKQGFGSLVSHYGSRLPVSLNTKAIEINWTGHGVKVKTSHGEIQAKAVILTVSTGVLASGDLKFNPELPVKKQESFNAISMGNYEHVCLLFSDDALKTKPDTYILKSVDESGMKFGALTNASESGLAYFDIGGNTALDLMRENEEARINLALEEFKNIFGNRIEQSFVKGAASSWRNNSYTQGAYASAELGASTMREFLRESIADKVFFAGEACHRTMWASVAGAHLSGQEVAANAAKTISKSNHVKQC